MSLRLNLKTKLFCFSPTGLTAMGTKKEKRKCLCLFSLKKSTKFPHTKQKQFRKLCIIQNKYSLHNSAICLEYLALTSVHKQLFSFLQLMDQKVRDHNKAAGNLHEFLYWLKKFFFEKFTQIMLDYSLSRNTQEFYFRDSLIN